MIGWRARIGVIVPGSNFALEPECYKMAPEGVSVHFSRLSPAESTPEHFQRMFDETSRAAGKLKEADVIGFGCTSGSMYKGLGHDQKIIKLMKKASGKPCTASATAVAQALKEMGIKKVSVATPYVEWVNQREKRFLEESGFKVLRIEGLGFDMKDITASNPDVAYKQAKKVDRPDADGIFISCTAFRTVEMLEILERDLGKPVVSSNQALMWMLLKMARVRGPICGFGKLLTKL